MGITCCSEIKPGMIFDGDDDDGNPTPYLVCGEIEYINTDRGVEKIGNIPRRNKFMKQRIKDSEFVYCCFDFAFSKSRYNFRETEINK